MLSNTDLKNNSVIDLKQISINYNHHKILKLIRIIHKK